MSKRHDAIFDDVLSGLPDSETKSDDRGGARFLKRSNALAESGEREEKTLRWVDAAVCRMWDKHNRAYDLLTEDNCRDLIDGIRSQGQQEFPAIVRRLPAGDGAEYEVICGARRHFAITWLNANNYPQFRYLIEVRDLTDEEAFRLADIENRDREDISDYERARDYAAAVQAYYGGKQKLMAQRLEVSEAWLSRYLQLSKLPAEIVNAYASIRDIKELHARQLKPLMNDKIARDSVLQAACDVADQQTKAREGQGAALDGAQVLNRLKAAVAPPKTAKPTAKAYGGAKDEGGVVMRRKGRKIVLEYNATLSVKSLQAAFDQILADAEANDL
ncbi:ParB/RepB/Spo0J family partition protein [Primorskyibacter marinus]|uniref:ParB/RepB/Spo0J family partition protein n=1 Tax=Primorskyibacter marinus TaxID=1977320 RepID=UPI000E308DA1|nr:ParB/RepB/Spo0J family partition protein [Primorskyibacter marinus]